MICRNCPVEATQVGCRTRGVLRRSRRALAQRGAAFAWMREGRRRLLPLGGLAFAGSRAVEHALPRHDFGHRLIDRHVLIGRHVLVAPRRAIGSAFLTADAVATALIGRLARRLLAIRPALAPGRRFLLGVAITAAPIRVRTAGIVPTLVAKALPPPPPRRLVIDIARRGLRLILVVGRRDYAVEPFANGCARPAGRSARNLAPFRTASFELPRRARFHSGPTHIVKSRMCTLFRADVR